GAVLRELDHLRARDELDDPLREPQLDRRRPREVRAPRQLCRHCLDDALVGVTQDDGAQPHAPIEEFAPVRVHDDATRSRLDERGGVRGELVVHLAVGMGAGRDEAAGELAGLVLCCRWYRSGKGIYWRLL